MLTKAEAGINDKSIAEAAYDLFYWVMHDSELHEL